MPKKQISVEVESSGYDLGQSIAQAVKAIKAASKVGGPVSAQIGVDLVAAITAFAPVSGELGSVGADLKESREEFIKGLNIAAYDIFDAAVQ